MNSMFETDPYPGRPKILFLGLGVSTHTHSWVDLLNGSQLNVRLFSVPGGGVPPADWKIRTYVCDPNSTLPKGLNPDIRQSFYLHPEENKRLDSKLIYRALVSSKKALSFTYKLFGMQGLDFRYADFPLNNIRIKSPDVWLAKIIQEWRPDIIHTLGLFDGQGGLYFFNVRKRFSLQNIGIWVIQVRGGADTFLRRYDPEIEKQIMDMFHECDQIIADNYDNLEYIKKLGYENKIANIAPVPGTGGINLKDNRDLQRIILPSARQRIIYWPKAYEGLPSKALPILEAIKLAWEKIRPCTIYLTAINNETEAWLATLPEDIKKNCIASLRLPRDQALEIMKRARVMLAPSLMDGVPNVLYEAMAYGAFPIVSPLEPIKPVVKNEENVLFARNLYPAEISEALVRAMSDDDLVDRAAQNNFLLVERIASRSMIAEKVIKYYQGLVG